MHYLQMTQKVCPKTFPGTNSIESPQTILSTSLHECTIEIMSEGLSSHREVCSYLAAWLSTGPYQTHFLCWKKEIKAKGKNTHSINFGTSHYRSIMFSSTSHACLSSPSFLVKVKSIVYVTWLFMSVEGKTVLILVTSILPHRKWTALFLLYSIASPILESILLSLTLFLWIFMVERGCIQYFKVYIVPCSVAQMN